MLHFDCFSQTFGEHGFIRFHVHETNRQDQNKTRKEELNHYSLQVQKIYDCIENTQKRIELLSLTLGTIGLKCYRQADGTKLPKQKQTGS